MVQHAFSAPKTIQVVYLQSLHLCSRVITLDPLDGPVEMTALKNNENPPRLVPPWYENPFNCETEFDTITLVVSQDFSKL